METMDEFDEEDVIKEVHRDEEYGGLWNIQTYIHINNELSEIFNGTSSSVPLK